jgi:hypothetical protein
LIATIKLKEVTASDLFRRLNSYSKQHALYHALKAFGQIPKSLFILRLIDDPALSIALERSGVALNHNKKDSLRTRHKEIDLVYRPIISYELEVGLCMVIVLCREPFIDKVQRLLLPGKAGARKRHPVFFLFGHSVVSVVFDLKPNLT